MKSLMRSACSIWPIGDVEADLLPHLLDDLDDLGQAGIGDGEQLERGGLPCWALYCATSFLAPAGS